MSSACIWKGSESGEGVMAYSEKIRYKPENAGNVFEMGQRGIMQHGCRRGM